MDEYVPPVWERTPTKDDFYYSICYRISFAEYFVKIEDSESHYKCRKHEWIEGTIGSIYYPQCPICSNHVEERTEEILQFKKYPDSKKLHTKLGNYQTLVTKEELEDFWEYMEDLYPFPEEFI
jgi:hypothetical protein